MSDVPVSLDPCHPTVAVLRSLLPAARVDGGTFRQSLPKFGTVTKADRQLLISQFRDIATEVCLDRLLAQHARRISSSIGRSSDGQRQWPQGFVGSVSHKGTVVLAAMAPRSVLAAVGIDLERYVPGELSAIADEVAPEGVPVELPKDLSVAIAFSAKEAVYKAQFPLTRQRLRFADVVLEWRSLTPSSANIDAHAGQFWLRVRAALVDGFWIVAAAEARADEL
jgi:4'-phosphopantetheinyl transferase EntD